MEGKHELLVTNHFFKVMMPGSHQKLNLPPIVSKELEKQKSRRVILESRIGKWRVSLCRNHENGLICLNQGWPQFVDRHALKLGEFVFFEHTGDLHFNVSVYKTNFCENEFDDDDEEVKEEEGTEALIPPKQSTMEKDKSTHFKKKMVPQFATKTARVTIPMEFMRWNNLGQQHTSVVLRDPNGRVWAVKLSVEKNRVNSFRMRRGWHDFYTSNHLKNEDTCVFHLNRPLLAQTTIFFNVQIIRALL